MLLQIDHTTVYRYARPVTLGTHRLMVRPMEGHDVQVRSSTLAITPACRTRWIQDVFGNSIAILDFAEPAAELRVESRVTVEQYNTNPFDFVLDHYAGELPFRYSEDEAIDIAPFLRRQFPQDEPAIQNWIRPYLNAQGRARTLDFLTAITRSMPLYFQYTRREEPGVQSPGETLNKRAGSCRDFALLLMEAARQLGLAARFASGYLCRASSSNQAQEAASDATHAWAEIYLPGAGWKGFDPTCGILAADLHLRVAVSRHPGQAAPVSGSFIGAPGDDLGMIVTVNARAAEDTPPAT